MSVHPFCWSLLLTVLAAPTAWAQEAPSQHSLPEALHLAKRTDRPVLAYVQAAWCGPCRRMERDVFPAVAPLLDRFVLARLAFDDHESRLRVGGVTRSPLAWARHFGAEATPTFVLLAPGGDVITQAHGFQNEEAFALLLAYVATGAYRHASFAQYVRQATPPP